MCSLSLNTEKIIPPTISQLALKVASRESEWRRK